MRIQFKVPVDARSNHISFKELFGGLFSCAVWGHPGGAPEISGSNQAAALAVRGRSCLDPAMMHLLRCLFSGGVVRVRTGCRLPHGKGEHVRHDLSRNSLSLFLSKAAAAPVCPELPRLLQDLDGGTSPRWTHCNPSLDEWTQRTYISGLGLYLSFCYACFVILPPRAC